MYIISGAQLQDIVNFGIEHPNAHFYCESMNDGNEFLSCTFFDDDDNNVSGFWELYEVKDNG